MSQGTKETKERLESQEIQSKDLSEKRGPLETLVTLENLDLMESL